MPFDGVTTFSVVKELNDNIIRGKINKIYQPEADEIILNIINKGQKYNLLLSANNNIPRVYLIQKTKENPKSPPMFCILLRKNLQNGIITGIRQVDLDRIIEIQINSKNELGDSITRKLIIEIMGRHSNIILVSEEGSIIDSIKRIGCNISSYREVLPGRTYIAPPQEKTDPRKVDLYSFSSILEENKSKTIYKFFLNNFMGISPPLSHELCHRVKVESSTRICEIEQSLFPSIFDTFTNFFQNLEDNLAPSLYTNENKSKIYDFTGVPFTYYSLYRETIYDSISALLEEFYYLKDNRSRIDNQGASILQMLNTKLDRNYQKLSKQQDEYRKGEEAVIYKKYGELITSQIYQIKPGEDSVELLDYYTNENIIIPLDKRLSPAENAQKYFKKYNKGKRAKEYLKEQIALTKEEIYYLESQLDNISKCTELDEFNEIKEELAENGYIKRASKLKKSRKNSSSKPMEFSNNGVSIFVGKNNRQNEYLSMKFANKTDLWLHVKDIPGSHVIVKKHYKEVDDNLLEKAALLAAYYSKAKNSSKVPVDYTAVKYVKKPKGAKTGMVIYTDQSTVYVTPAEDAVLKLSRVNSN